MGATVAVRSIGTNTWISSRSVVHLVLYVDRAIVHSVFAQ